jgi:3-hydroxybutyryl-CoA dehydrogenase
VNDSKSIKRVLVVGAGTMGHAIGLVFARGGLDVDLVDMDETVLKRATGLIGSALDTLVEAKWVRRRSVPAILRRIHPSRTLDGAGRADLVVEAISEDAKAKRSLFTELDRRCRPEAIFASNTSYLDIFKAVPGIRPERMVIAHWWAPPHLLPLVDVVKGPKTSAAVVKTVCDLLGRMGKRPVVMRKFIPGYIVNRLQRAMAREIFHLLDQGYASAEDIDAAVKWSIGLRIPVAGVVQRMDFGGLDLVQSFGKNKAFKLVSKDVPSKTLDRLVKAGRLGIKTGRGFYDYRGSSTAEILRERDRRMIALIEFVSAWGPLGRPESDGNPEAGSLV